MQPQTPRGNTHEEIFVILDWFFLGDKSTLKYMTNPCRITITDAFLRLLTVSPCLLETWAEYQCQRRRSCGSSTRSTRRLRGRSQRPTRRCQGARRASTTRMLSSACWRKKPQSNFCFSTWTSTIIHAHISLGVKLSTKAYGVCFWVCVVL